MSGQGNIKIEGDEALIRAFDNLGDKAIKKIARTAVTKGGRVAAKAMKSGAPAKPKIIKQSIKSRVVSFPRDGNFVAIIGPQTKLRDDKGKTATARAFIAEFGLSNVPANPFMRRSFQSSAAAVARKIQGGILAGIEQEARK